MLAMLLAHPMEDVDSLELEAFIDRKAQQRLEFRTFGRPLKLGLGLRIIDRPVLPLRLDIDGFCAIVKVNIGVVRQTP